MVKMAGCALVLALAAVAQAPFLHHRRTASRPPPAAGGGQTISDNFNRGDSADLGANWTVLTGEAAWKISVNTAQPSSTTTDCTEYYSGVSWTANQSSEGKVTVVEITAGNGVGVAVRCSTSARTYYRLVINSDGEWKVAKMVAGVYTVLTSGTATYSVGAVLKLTVSGTTLTSVYNGVQIGSTTDSAISSGSPGIMMSSTIISGSVDDWTGIDGL